MTPQPPGKLMLVATPIGNLADLSPRAATALRDADWIYAEDTRRARALLTHCAIPAAGRLRSLHAHNEATRSQQIAELVSAGAVVAYVSDAGTPGISDPGERLVGAMARASLDVDFIPGPTALIGALVVSGLPTAPFTFYGFLARKGRERAACLRAIAESRATSVLYESPRRLAATLSELCTTAGTERAATVVRELTKVHEEVRRGTLGELVAALADGTLNELGECVIVIGPNVAESSLDEAELSARIDELLDSGVSARDAATTTASEFSIAHRQAYAAVLAQRRLRPT